VDRPHHRHRAGFLARSFVRPMTLSTNPAKEGDV
jgi:hypothetical protein